MTQNLSDREQAHADRTAEDLERNKHLTGVVSTLALIQDIDGVEIDFSNQMNQRVRVRRNGIVYGINERSGPSAGGKLGRYVYAVGADLGDGLEFPVLRGNCYGSFDEALHALRKCIIADPRQSDIAEHHLASHFSVSVPVPADD